MRSSTFFPPVFALCLLATHGTCAVARQAGEAQDGGPRIELNVNRIFVPVVVRDKKGRVVGDLKMEDFQVFDNGAPHVISGLTVEKPAPSEGKTRGHAEGVETHAAAGQGAPESSSLPRRITVLLFDDLHMSAEDLAISKKTGAKALAGLLTGSDMAAVVSLSGKTNSGLTRDPAKLRETIESLQPRSVYRSNKADCPLIDYYEANLIKNQHNKEANDDALDQVKACMGVIPSLAQAIVDTTSMRVLNLGRQDVMTTYANVAEFLGRMAHLPGQRTLILVSSGFLNIEPEAVAAESRVIDLAAQSGVIVSALDARGVYTTNVTASENTLGRSPGLMESLRSGEMTQAGDAMAELADGTGGRFFHGSNDLDAGFAALAEAPEEVYELELPLGEQKPDGSWHRLTVKVDREGVEVQARRGYYVPLPGKAQN